MQLTYEQLAQAACGVAYCEEKNGEVFFHRFTKEQEKLYSEQAPNLASKLWATAGVSLRFTTDSPTLDLAIRAVKASTRSYFTVDILVNGTYLDCIRNFEEEEMGEDYPTREFPLGAFQKSFALGEGKKQITLLLPALTGVSVTALSLQSGASFAPAPKQGTYLALGDSITQGYDCTHTRNRYTNRIAAALNLCEHNLGVGGEVFRAPLAETIRNTKADFITVAYGSNDWRRRSFEETRASCEGFLDALTGNLPGKTIYVISPIWRKDGDEISDFGAFERVEMMLRTLCDKYPRLHFVRGYDFVPHNTALFGDGSLHPNDEGFLCYANSFLQFLHKEENRTT